MDYTEAILDIKEKRNYDKFDLYLKQQEINPHKYLRLNMEGLLGWAMLEYNPVVIAKLCLFIREFELDISKDDVLRSIYDARCAKRYNARYRLDGTMSEYGPYNIEYIQQYEDMVHMT